MIEANLPISFWYLACETAVFLINRTITSALPGTITPFEMWYFRKPSISHLKVFGCKVYRLIRKELRETKYHPVSAEGVLVGYEHDNFNYLIFDLKTKKLVTSHDVTFVED